MNTPAAVLISARRSAVGRVGGLHRNRRIEELAEPVLRSALSDSGCPVAQIGGMLLGNTTTGSKAARAIGLAAGLPETSYSVVLDSACASGLEAIVDAVRRISSGAAEALVAGGAESVSTAPWRIGRPKNPYQMPHFIGYQAPGMEARDSAEAFEADERLARELGISREAQDAYALHAHLLAEQARERRQFIGEIIGIRATPEETRDQTGPEPDLDDLADLQPYQSGDGTVTAGNTSTLADAAAFAVVVSGNLWETLGRPKGLVLQRSLACGVPLDQSASAAHIALATLLLRGRDKASRDIASVAAVETSEASAVEAIALARGLKLADGVLNGGGGALVRGLPLGASSAVGVARLFTRLLRSEKPAGRCGAVVQRASGGLGLAAIFETVG